MTADILQIRRELDSVVRAEAKLRDGGEPPYDGGMEARVSRLEEFARDAGERLARVETKLDHVLHETGQFKWWAAGSAVAIILTMIGTVLGTGVAIQQMTVATFQAASALQTQVPPAAPTPAKAASK